MVPDLHVSSFVPVEASLVQNIHILKTSLLRHFEFTTPHPHLFNMNKIIFKLCANRKAISNIFINVSCVLVMNKISPPPNFLRAHEFICIHVMHVQNPVHQTSITTQFICKNCCLSCDIFPFLVYHTC